MTWRLAANWSSTRPAGPVGALSSALVVVMVLGWAATGPTQPGWARKAGTPQVAAGVGPIAAAGATTPTLGRAGSTSTTATGGRWRPVARHPRTGTIDPERRGGSRTTVAIDATSRAAPPATVQIVLEGTALDDGGLALRSGHRVLRPDQPADGLSGPVTALSRARASPPRSARPAARRHTAQVAAPDRSRVPDRHGDARCPPSEPIGTRPDRSATARRCRLTDPVRLLPRPAVDGHAGHLARYGPLPRGRRRARRRASRRPGCAAVAEPGSRPPPSCGPWPPGAGARSSWPTAPRASRPAPRTRCCCGARPTWCSTASSWWPTLLGAGEAYPVRRPQLARRASHAVERARDERPEPGAGGASRSLTAPDRYVAGEETALVHWLNGGEAKPTFVPPRPFERGVRGRPTLISNVETYAHIAPRSPATAPTGTGRSASADAPGTTLLTVDRAAWPNPGSARHPGGSSLGAVHRRRRRRRRRRAGGAGRRLLRHLDPRLGRRPGHPRSRRRCGGAAPAWAAAWSPCSPTTPARWWRWPG